MINSLIPLDIRKRAKRFFVSRDVCAKANSTIRVFAKIAKDMRKKGQVLLTRAGAVARQGHHSIGDIKATESNAPLKTTNKGLVLALSRLIQKRGSIEFRMCIFGKRGKATSRFAPHLTFILLKGTLNVALCSPYESTVGVAGDRTTKKDVGIIGNTLQAIAAEFKFSKEGSGISHNGSYVVTIRANILITVTSIAHPNIRIGEGGAKTHGGEGIKEKIMEGLSSSAKTVASLADNHHMTSAFFKFRTSNKVNKLSIPGHEVGRGNITNHNVESVELPKKQSQTEGAKRNDRGIAAVRGNISRLIPTSYKSSPSSTIVFGCIYHHHGNTLVTLTTKFHLKFASTGAQVFKDVELAKKPKLKTNSIAPKVVAILFI